MEYRGTVASDILNGDAHVRVGRDGFDIVGDFDALHLPFTAVGAVTESDYAIRIEADDGPVVLSRMGHDLSRAYAAIREAFEAALLRAFFVRDAPLASATGDAILAGAAGPRHREQTTRMEVHANAVVLLTPDDNAVRLPLAFVTDIDAGDYALTLRLGPGEQYTLARLGYRMAPFADGVRRRVRAMRRHATVVASNVDAAASPGAAMRLGAATLGGRAAPLAALEAASATFRGSVETLIAASRVAETWAILSGRGADRGAWLGLVEFDADGVPVVPDDDAEGAAASPATASPATEGEAGLGFGEIVPWFIAPSPCGRFAAVELPVAGDEAAATYVYRTGGDFTLAAGLIARALEAVAYHRDVIRFTDAELAEARHADHRLAVRHTPALRWLRANLAGRVIHTGADAWGRGLDQVWA